MYVNFEAWKNAKEEERQKELRDKNFDWAEKQQTKSNWVPATTYSIASFATTIIRFPPLP